MTNPSPNLDPTVVAVVAGCAILDVARTKAQKKILECRYERRAAKIRAIVEDRLYLSADELKAKYGPNCHPIV